MPEEGQGQGSFAFDWFGLLQLVHTFVRRFPILVPKILKFNCSKMLKQGSSPAVQKVLLRLLHSECFHKKISFLTVIVRGTRVPIAHANI